MAVPERLLTRRAERFTELRDLLRARGYQPPNGVAMSQLLAECPDVDLAFTALTMVPRPRWVMDLAGPLEA